MTGSPVRAIIFDIGRVLIRIDLRRAQRGLAKGKSLTPEELWSAIEKDPRWRDWQEGRMSARDWHLNLSNRLGLSLPFDQFTQVWNSALDPEPIHPDSFFEQLARNFKLTLLSNTDPIHVSYMESTFAFFRYFPKDARTYSCSVGASKPDPLIFREALKAAKVRADQAVYVDDIAAYAESARALGLRAIHYQSPPQLHRELLALGIKVE